MHRAVKLNLTELNDYLVCKLCNGYLIDPCTAQECLHSFCKTCIVRHIHHKGYTTCPVCGVVIHKTRPLEMIRHDQTLQDLVYKLVPGVFKNEMERRREFYAEHPESGLTAITDCEARGEVKEDREILAEDDCISLALVHSPNGEAKPATEAENGQDLIPVIYLRCPAVFSVSGIKKIIKTKFDLSGDFLIDVFHSDESLSDDYTLMDIAYIYTWRRRGPLRVFYTIYQFDPSLASQGNIEKPANHSQIIESAQDQSQTNKNFQSQSQLAENQSQLAENQSQLAENQSQTESLSNQPMSIEKADKQMDTVENPESSSISESVDDEQRKSTQLLEQQETSS